jgi:hypothetical protein
VVCTALSLNKSEETIYISFFIFVRTLTDVWIMTVVDCQMREEISCITSIKAKMFLCDQG